MSRISQDIDKLEGMIDDNAEKEDIKVQLRFIATQVATLEAQYATLEQEHAEFEAAQAEASPDPPFEHARGVYYASGDPIPYCPRCYEAPTPVRVHLFGPVPLWANKMAERWECHACDTAYGAVDSSQSFLPSPRVPRPRKI